MEIEWITQSELARRLNVSPPYISKKIRQGVLKLNEDKKLDFEKSKAVLNVRPKIFTQENTTNSKNIDKNDDEKIKIIPLEKAMTIIKSTQAQNDIIDLKIKQKKFIDKTKVERDIFKAVRMMRDNLLGLGDRLKSELSVILDPYEIKKIIDDEVTKNLENLAKGIKIG